MVICPCGAAADHPFSCKTINLIAISSHQNKTRKKLLSLTRTKTKNLRRQLNIYLNEEADRDRIEKLLQAEDYTMSTSGWCKKAIYRQLREDEQKRRRSLLERPKVSSHKAFSEAAATPTDDEVAGDDEHSE